MKEIILRVDDSAYDKFMGCVALMPLVDVVDSGEEGCDALGDEHACFAAAVEELTARKVLKTSADYTYIMQVVLDGKTGSFLPFTNPDEFLEYLKIVGLTAAPGRSTLYRVKGRITGCYPDWSFRGELSQFETVRRKGVAAQFLSCFLKRRRKNSQ